MTEEQDKLVNAGAQNGPDENPETAPTDEAFVTAEKKPLNQSALVLFGILVVGVAGMYLMYLRTGPKPASAATAEAKAAHQTITKFLDAGDQNRRWIQDLWRDTERFRQQFLTYPNGKQVPLSDLRTNPFRQTAAGDDRRPGKDERAVVMKAVQALQLQSVLCSGTRTACMINNTLYQEGQQVGQFTIERINAAGVIVRSGQYRFELRMQK